MLNKNSRMMPYSLFALSLVLTLASIAVPAQASSCPPYLNRGMNDDTKFAHDLSVDAHKLLDKNPNSLVVVLANKKTREKSEAVVVELPDGKESTGYPSKLLALLKTRKSDDENFYVYHSSDVRSGGDIAFTDLSPEKMEVGFGPQSGCVKIAKSGRFVDPATPDNNGCEIVDFTKPSGNGSERVPLSEGTILYGGYGHACRTIAKSSLKGTDKLSDKETLDFMQATRKLASVYGGTSDRSPAVDGKDAPSGPVIRLTRKKTQAIGTSMKDRPKESSAKHDDKSSSSSH